MGEPPVSSTGKHGRDPIELRAGLAFVRLQDEGIVHDDRGGVVHVLNATATVSWELLQRGATREEVVETLAAQHGVPYAQVDADVTALLAQMEALELLAAPGGDMAPE
jgi:hypothetical protein